jgi:hypothetical protein
MRSGLVILILFFSLVRLYAQDADNGELEPTHALMAPDQLPTSRNYQHENVIMKKFDDAKWKEIAGTVNFNEKPVEIDEQRQIAGPWAGTVFKLISYIVIIGLVVLLLYYVVMNTYFEAKIKRMNIQGGDLQKAIENIEELDVDGLLDRAKKEGNFKVAVRLYYLSLLKKLHSLGVIAWKKDKTNRDYLGELLLQNFYFDEVRKLTLFYEAVWYGEHILKEASFQHLASEFETVFLKIKP